ncbi:MAG: cupin domain-containing protein [Flavobacteriaceae bacterium]
MSKEKYTLQKLPFIVPTEDGKYIGEHFGRATHDKDGFSLAHMKAPAGWKEPFQCPEFAEYTLVISGKKQIQIDEEIIVLNPGESIRIEKGIRVRYSNPFDTVCEYISICTPSFDFTKVHREED